MVIATNGHGKGPLRIAAFSGYTGDRYDALLTQAKGSGAAVLFGDYLAEMNLAWRALEIKDHPELGYETTFLSHLKLAAKAVKASGARVITNAGALNPKGCAEAAAKILQEQGIEMKIAYVEGDDILPRLAELAADGETFAHLEPDGTPVSSWQHQPLTANAYVGARGIAEALKAGAEMIISGRCTDASPVIAAAQWWHGWSWDEYDALAGALLAGHCLECGAYVTGGNSSGFKEIMDTYYNFAMGIGEIEADGTFVITKQPSSSGLNGRVNDVTVRSQILYEIQGNIYLNPDVQGIIDDIKVENVGPDRVRVTGVRGVAPPDTTKAAFCAVAGYQAEVSIYGTGLDVTEKFEVMKLQIYKFLGENIKKFSTFDITQYGVPAVNPANEAIGTAMLRVFAQASDIEAFGEGPVKSLMRSVWCDGLGHFPGFHSSMDMRTAVPKPYIEYFPARVAQKYLPLKVSFVGSKQTIDVPPPQNTTTRLESADYDSKDPAAYAGWGETTEGPLGWIVHARSGDKGGNANVGFFVRTADEYPWLQSILSKDRMIKLMGEEYRHNKIERVEFPGMLAVHFVLHDYLDKGVSSTPRMDCLAKSVAEFLRSRYVPLPNKLLARGKL